MLVTFFSFSRLCYKQEMKRWVWCTSKQPTKSRPCVPSSTSKRCNGEQHRAQTRTQTGCTLADASDNLLCKICYVLQPKKIHSQILPYISRKTTLCVDVCSLKNQHILDQCKLWRPMQAQTALFDNRSIATKKSKTTIL